jgi:transposase
LKQIATVWKTSTSSIQRVLQNFKDTGNFKTKEYSGRPRLTTKREDRNIVQMSKQDCRRSSVQIAAEFLTAHGSKLSVTSIKRRLLDAGLYGRHPVKKPLISEKNRLARLRFAKQHLHWSINDWKKVVWTDESKFLLFGSDGINYVRRPIGQRFNPKYQLPTIKHGGGSVMLWGAFHGYGLGPLHRINGIMNTEDYLNILQNVFLPYARCHLQRGWIYQDDNDPKHSAKAVSKWFHDRRVCRLEWPSQSPDLNLIEHLWKKLDDECKGLRAANVDQKFEQLYDRWKAIPQSFLDSLIESMPRRCEAVIQSKGYATKY